MTQSAKQQTFTPAPQVDPVANKNNEQVSRSISDLYKKIEALEARIKKLEA